MIYYSESSSGYSLIDICYTMCWIYIFLINSYLLIIALQVGLALGIYLGCDSI